MGKRGPQPKSKKIDELNGNPGNRPEKPDPVKATGSADPAEWLSEYGQEIWASVVGSMPPGFYATADAMILAAYCQACDMAKQAAGEIAERGITIENNQGNIVRNPAAPILSDALAKIATLGTRLGLDPAARQSIGIVAGNPDKPDEGAEGFGNLIGIDGGKKTA